MALLTARADRSRALDWIQIGADGRPDDRAAVGRAALGQPAHPGQRPGRRLDRRPTWPSCRRWSTRSTPARSPSRSTPCRCAMSRRPGLGRTRRASERSSCPSSDRELPVRVRLLRLAWWLRLLWLLGLNRPAAEHVGRSGDTRVSRGFHRSVDGRGGSCERGLSRSDTRDGVGHVRFIVLGSRGPPDRDHGARVRFADRAARAPRRRLEAPARLGLPIAAVLVGLTALAIVTPVADPVLVPELVLRVVRHRGPGDRPDHHRLAPVRPGPPAVQRGRRPADAGDDAHVRQRAVPVLPDGQVAVRRPGPPPLARAAAARGIRGRTAAAANATQRAAARQALEQARIAATGGDQDAPVKGVTVHIAIPGTVSGFNAREAYVWLPPVWFTDPMRKLPVIELIAGAPGTPVATGSRAASPTRPRAGSPRPTAGWRRSS